MRRSRLIVLCVCTALLVATVAYSAYDWWATVDLSAPDNFAAEWDYAGGQHHVRVKIDRGSYNPTTGTVRLSASVDVDEPNVIRGIWIETADDSNANGNIENAEWAMRATGTVTSTQNATTAIVPPLDLDVKRDGYRLRWTWEDGGQSAEEVLAPGLTAD